MRARYARFVVAFLLLAAWCLLLPEGILAAEGESKWGVLLPIGRVFNLGLVIFVLVWVAKKPLQEFYASRSENIRERLAEAQKARDEAEAKLAEVQERMSRLDEELRSIKAAAEKEAREERERLLAAAERDAQKIIERARQEIEGLTRTASLELRAHIADLSVQLAEQKIRSEITDQDRGRLFGRFVSQFGGKG